MGADLHLIAEIKKDGQWKALGNGGCYSFNYWKSSVEATNFLGLVLCRRSLCGWYDDNKVPFIMEEPNGQPDNLSDTVKNEYVVIEGYVTSEQLEKFNWDFEISYYSHKMEEEHKQYLVTGILPEGFVSYQTNGNEKTFGKLFKDEYSDFLKELKYLKTLGEDYRLLYYFE